MSNKKILIAVPDIKDVMQLVLGDYVWSIEEDNLSMLYDPLIKDSQYASNHLPILDSYEDTLTIGDLRYEVRDRAGEIMSFILNLEVENE